MDFLPVLLITLAPFVCSEFTEEAPSCSSFMCAYQLGEKITLLDLSASKNRDEITRLKQETADQRTKLEKCQKDSEKMKEELKEITGHLQNRGVVAAYVRLSNTVKLNNGQRLIYDTIVTNIGEGYDPVKGQFTAPSAGVYSVNILACTGASAHWMNVAIMKNEEMIGKVRTGDDSYYECTSANVIVQLSKGDNIWVKRDDGATAATFDISQGWNTLSVNLLG